jgi:hypothetical protein
VSALPTWAWVVIALIVWAAVTVVFVSVCMAAAKGDRDDAERRQR